MAEIVGTAFINNGPPVPAKLRIEQETRIEHTNLPQPNPAWTFVDASGHFHAYDRAEELPTLEAKTEQAPCDGSCGGVCQGEGYTVTHWLCRICGEEVKPGTLAGPHSFPIRGRMSWSLDIPHLTDLDAPLDGEVSVRFETTGATHFGVAVVTSFEASDDRLSAGLRGAGPLGQSA